MSPPRRLITTDNPLAQKLAGRFATLAESCAKGKLLRAVEGLRVAECKRSADTTVITLKLLIENVQHFSGHLKHTETGLAFSLHSANNKEAIQGLNSKREKYLLGLLSWAETALASASPAPSNVAAHAWKKPLFELHTLLTGLSAATSRKRLNGAFFPEHEYAPHDARLDALLYQLAEDGYLLTFDWKEDERFGLIEALANQRRLKGTPASHLACVTPPRLRAMQLHAFLAAQGLSLVSIESGADTEIIGIAARADLEQLRTTLHACGRRLWLDVALQEDDGNADGTDPPCQTTSHA